eukprot:916975-Rhodomonas_salina.1
MSAPSDSESGCGGLCEEEGCCCERSLWGHPPAYPLTHSHVLLLLSSYPLVYPPTSLVYPPTSPAYSHTSRTYPTTTMYQALLLCAYREPSTLLHTRLLSTPAFASSYPLSHDSTATLH